MTLTPTNSHGGSGGAAGPTTTTTMQNAATATGNGTSMTVAGLSLIGIQVVISATATVILEGTQDGTNYQPLSLFTPQSATLAVTNGSTTATGFFVCSVGGFTAIRARISSYGSGTVTVTGTAVDGTYPFLADPVSPPLAMNIATSRTANLASPRAAIQMLKDANDATGTFISARANNSAVLLASAARTATTSSADQDNVNGKGVIVVVNVTAEAGVTTLTLTIQGKDSISGNYYDLITGIVVYNAATDTPTTTRAVMIQPGVINADAIGAGVANLISAKSLALPRTWRATITPSDASSQTYSVSGVTLL